MRHPPAGPQKGLETVDKASVAQTGRQDSEETETRECRSCLATGYVLLDAHYDDTTGELKEEAAPCMICKGAGQVSSFLYRSGR